MQEEVLQEVERPRSDTPSSAPRLPGPFRILSIDGGGIRGAFSVHVLKRIQAEFGVDYARDFDVIAGTSAGAISAAVLAAGKSIDRIEFLFHEHGTQIFRRRWWAAKGYLASRCNASLLKEMLDRELATLTLGEITKPALIIPATDISNGQVHIFKSRHDPLFFRDKSVRLADAVLASCSAPLHFPPHGVGHYRIADGGLWANNPSHIATVEAMHRFKVSPSNISVLSIGTGHECVTYMRGRGLLPTAWGFLTGWRRRELVELILGLQSQSAENITRLLLGERVLRLSFSDNKLPLDDPTAIPDLCARADMLVSHKSKDIRAFLETIALTPEPRGAA